MSRLAVGIVLFVLVAGAALLSGWLWAHDPLEPNYRNLYAAASAEHPLGTDGLGRDVLVSGGGRGRLR